MGMRFKVSGQDCGRVVSDEVIPLGRWGNRLKHGQMRRQIYRWSGTV